MTINMEYCRFENTSKAMGECLDSLKELSITDDGLDLSEMSDHEKTGLAAVVDLSRRITEWADDCGIY